MKWNGEYNTKWVKKFALFPTSIEGGSKTVWLQSYYKRFVDAPQRKVKRGECYTCDHINGSWETKEII